MSEETEEQEKAIPSRAIIELKDGRMFSTVWGTPARDPHAIPVAHLFTGRLAARVIGSEDFLPSSQIKRICEEVMRDPEGDQYQRVTLVRRAPNVTPKGRKILAGAAKFLEYLEGMSLNRVDEIIDDPNATWDGWNGAVVYSDGAFQVVVGQQWDGADFIIHISRNDPGEQAKPSHSPTRDRRRQSGQKADRRRPVPTSVVEFLDRLKEYGFDVDDTRRHYGISHPNRPGVTTPIPRSPSDYRWADNQVSQIKQTFGIDVRQPLD